MGFSQISFPVSLILRSVAALREGLDALRRHAEGVETLQPFGAAAAARATLDEAVALREWRLIETTHAPKG